MNFLVLYLNELSCSAELDDPNRLGAAVRETIHALRRVRHIRTDSMIASEMPLSKTYFGNGQHSMSSLLKGNSREEWQFIRSLDNRSPFDPQELFNKTAVGRELSVQGLVGRGVSLAWHHDSAALSVGAVDPWGIHEIQAKYVDAESAMGHAVQVRNISNECHADFWKDHLVQVGKTLAATSIVFAGETFVLRMFSNDHNPPHVHVFESVTTSITIARICIKSLEVSTGEIGGALRRSILEKMREKRDALLESWERCRRGERPLYIGD